MMSSSEKTYRVLVADDQSDVLEALKILLRSEGFDVSLVRSPKIVLDSIAIREYDALLLDLNYGKDTVSGREGIELIAKIKEIDDQIPVIAITAWGTIDLAVEAVRVGARDFIQKPWDDERLVSMVRTQAEIYRAIRQKQRLAAENRLLHGQGKITYLAEAPASHFVLDTILQVGPSDANVLITGEHGTGKEVVARALHASSLRSNKPLVAVNTGGLPEGTFESELFGHIKGAFTDAKSDRIGRFELADGGTLFLDEIANVPLRQQAKLLRVLETGEMERVGSSRSRQVNVRVLSATNANLNEACAAGRFREDLLFRLNTVEIHVPPLRQRREDIPVLSAHFLSKYATKYKKEINFFSAEAMEKLLAHSWPGNVRELEHTIERAVIMCREKQIQAGNLGLQTSGSRSADLTELSLEEAEALLISKALARYDGNITQAAEVLGLSRGTFYRRMEKHGFYASSADRKQKS